MEGKDISTDWRKSSFSNGGGNACVEVGTAGGVLVRDTTDRAGGTLSFTGEAWQEFVTGLK